MSLLLKAESEVLLAFSRSLAATPLSGLLDQNKLKKALRTLSVFNLFPPLVLSLALFLSHSLSLFLSCSCFPKCMYKGGGGGCPLPVPRQTSHFNPYSAYCTSHLLLTHFKHLWVFISHCLCHPFFVSLFYILTPSSFLFPYLPWVWMCSFWLSSLSLHTVCPTKDHSCSYGNQLATMLENIIMLAQKEISSPSRELCSRTAVLLSNFHML